MGETAAATTIGATRKRRRRTGSERAAAVRSELGAVRDGEARATALMTCSARVSALAAPARAWATAQWRSEALDAHSLRLLCAAPCLESARAVLQAALLPARVATSASRAATPRLPRIDEGAVRPPDVAAETARLRCDDEDDDAWLVAKALAAPSEHGPEARADEDAEGAALLAMWLAERRAAYARCVKAVFSPPHGSRERRTLALAANAQLSSLDAATLDRLELPVARMCGADRARVLDAQVAAWRRESAAGCLYEGARAHAARERRRAAAERALRAGNDDGDADDGDAKDKGAAPSLVARAEAASRSAGEPGPPACVADISRGDVEWVLAPLAEAGLLRMLGGGGEF